MMLILAVGLVVLMMGLLHLCGVWHCDWVLHWIDTRCGCRTKQGPKRKSLCPKRKPPCVCGCVSGFCACAAT